tara:strand:- start:233 stop:1189 length:957 start_codon:yes stop_codon:yes gene_type:complete
MTNESRKGYKTFRLQVDDVKGRGTPTTKYIQLADLRFYGPPPPLLHGEVFTWQGPSNGPWPLSFLSTPALKIKDDFSAMVWVRATSRSPDWVRIVGKGGSGSRNYALWVKADGITYGNFAYGKIQGGSVRSPTAIPLGKWTHLCMRYRRGTANEIYMDGKLMKSVAVSNNDPNMSDEPITIGDVGSGWGGYRTQWRGEIARVRVFNRALDAEEIESAARAPPPPPLKCTGKVELFQHNLNGKVLRVGVGRYDYHAVVRAIGNDQASSIRVPPGCIAEVYEHNFSGRKSVFSAGTYDYAAYTKKAKDNDASSMVVKDAR